MTIPEKAAKLAIEIAENDAHGYDQTSRWGPDFDCSSFVIQCYKDAGEDTHGASWTGNFLPELVQKGPFNKYRPEDLNCTLPGDILLNVQHHAAICIGNGQLVEASIAENGTAHAGEQGDQTGHEIHIRDYYNYPWNYVLRHRDADSAPQVADSDTYTVKRGDTLYGIAERFGVSWKALAEYNELEDPALIYPGQLLHMINPAEHADPEQKSYKDKIQMARHFLMLAEEILKEVENGI